jgi:SnoaL-like domain
MRLTVRRFRALAFVACIASSLCIPRPLLAQTGAPPVDPTLIAPIDTFISAVLSNSPKQMPAAFASSSTILDDVPPNVFSGPDAYLQWYDAFLATNAKQKITVVFLGHGSPHYAHVAGDRAYVVLPTDFTYTIAGKPYAESGAWTFGLVKQGGDWKIASWAWSLLTDTGE